MTAVAERPAAVLPDVEQLTERQLLGIDCAWCGAYLGIDARRLGDIEDRGYPLQLFGCDPRCALVPLPRRGSVAAGQPVAVPPWRGSPLDHLPRWTAAPAMPDPLADSDDNSAATVRRVVAGLRALSDAPP